jgi:hypothetical protein
LCWIMGLDPYLHLDLKTPSLQEQDTSDHLCQVDHGLSWNSAIFVSRVPVCLYNNAISHLIIEK